LFVGCGGTDTGNDGGAGGTTAGTTSGTNGGTTAGTTGGTTAGTTGGTTGGTTIFHVGSGQYKVTTATKTGADDCGLKLDAPNAMFAGVKLFPLTVNNVTGDTTLGDDDPRFNPVGPSQGKGVLSANKGTLTVDTTFTTTDNVCSYHMTRTNNLTVTADYTISVDFTEQQTNHSAGCDVKMDCTSTFNFVIVKQ
jgi:hypothetical protein